MKTISQKTIKEIIQIYDLEQTHQELREAHERSGKDEGWLRVVMSSIKSIAAANDLVQEFGGDLAFICALAEYLIDNNLIPKTKYKRVSAEIDFIDQLQERVV